MIESSKRWWKCRNRFNQIGFVPFNILEPMDHIDSPVTSRPPSVRRTQKKKKKSQRVCAHLGVRSSIIYPLHSTFLQVPVPPAVTRTFSAVPLSPLAPPSPHSTQRPHSLPAYSQHIPAVDDAENKGTDLCVCVGSMYGADIKNYND